jgi:hypothetical protein
MSAIISDQCPSCPRNTVRHHAGILSVAGRNTQQGALASGISGVLLKTVDLFGQGSIVTEVGEYELKSKEGQVLDHGKYIVVWRREGETWKLLRDMFSTNVASAPK